MLEKKRERYINYCNIFYFIVLAAFIIHTYFDNTTFKLPWPNHYYEILRIAMVGIVLVKFGLDDSQPVREVIQYFLFWLILTLAAQKTGYIFLTEISFLVLGAKNVPFIKIAKLYLGISVCILLITFIGALSGVIPNYIFYIGRLPKNSFGMLYSTDFAAHIFFTALIFVYIRGKKVSYIECLLFVLSGIVVYIYTRAKMNSGGLILLGVLLGLIKSLNVLGKRKKWIQNLKRMLLALMSFSFIIFSVLSIALSFFYNAENLYFNKLNTILNNRLMLARNGISNYGFTLLGRPFELIGTDFIQKEGYNFIDSSYILVMLRYGFLTLCLFVVMFTLISYKAKKINDDILLVVLTLLAIQCSIEHHLTELNYNIFLLLPFTLLEKKNVGDIKKTECARENIAYKLIFTFAIFFIFIQKNFILSFLRTLVTILKLNHADNQIYFVMFSIAFLGVILLLSLFFMSNIKFKNGITIIIILITSFALYNFRFTLMKYYKLYEIDIKNTKEKLKKFENNEYEIYVQDIPYFYLNEFDNIHPGIPYAKSLKKSIVIVSDKEEQISLLKNGYQCARLNSLEYIYTNDETVIEYMSQNGLEFKRYYDYIKDIDLKKMADINKLKEVNGKLILNGHENSLYSGPWDMVGSGDLNIICDMKLISNNAKDDEIATFSATYQNGSKEIINYKIKKSDFASDSTFLLKLTKSIKDISDLEIKIYVQDGVTLQVNFIKYFKTG